MATTSIVIDIMLKLGGLMVAQSATINPLGFI
jgi:hypothetical protein